MSRAGLFRTLSLTALAAFVLLPFLQAVELSFTITRGAEGAPAGTFGLHNYVNILGTPALRDSIINSVIYVLLNVIFCLVAGLPAAYGLARYTFVGDRHFLFFLLAFRVTPPVVLSLPIFILFARAGLVNTPVGIALVHCVFNLPIAIWILESFITAIPRSFDEMAFIDGHSRTGFFLKFLIPALAPGIAVAAFFCFIFSWVEVVLARTLTVTGGKPITQAITSLFSFQTDWGLVMAMTVFSLIPGVLMIFLVRNHIARGFVVRT
jgi:glycerol transport system permease protein